MRSAGQIAGAVFMLLFFAFSVSAQTDNAASEESQIEAVSFTAEKYIDPDLENILAEKDSARYEFLARLTPEEQRELAVMIRKRVEDEVGVVVSLMAVVSRFVPAFMAAPFTDKLEPATVARISDKISINKAIAIARRLDPEFLAEVAVYQDPKKVTAVVEGLPEPLLEKITRILIANAEYRVVANFSDDMSAEKLKNLTIRINDAASLIRIVRHMHNRDKIVETAVMFSDDYLLDFMSLIASDADYEMAAAIGQALAADRRIKILNRLDPQQAARLAAHYSPETIVLIMEQTDNEMLDKIALNLSPETMGHISGALNTESMDRFIQTIPKEQISAALPYINLIELERRWPELAPETRAILRDVAGDYPLLVDVIDFAEKNKD